MMKTIGFAAAVALAAPVAAQAQAQAAALTDPQIAHIAYTAGAIDVEAGRQAIARAQSPAVRAFAETMVRDHQAVNEQALALVRKLGVTPQDNPTSQALSAEAAKQLKAQAALSGAAFDRAYVTGEVTFHKTVNGALSGLLIPSAGNAELKDLLEAGLKLFSEHQGHAEHLAMTVR
ncbi:DUF4142 domain-containing protein [Sphingomonas flavalba]|uniref:DUF4142 domain-containing protein n=1 Tax=Sphingomonas flavalba TaxID=2559804 RepID=UPI0039E134E4